jgi:hypothetical protein
MSNNYDMRYFLEHGISMPKWRDINVNYDIRPVFTPIVVDPNLPVITATDKYFTEKLKKVKEKKDFDEEVKKLTDEERVRYEAQKDFLKTGKVVDLDKEQLKVKEFTKSKQAYNELQDYMSPVFLSKYGINEPTLRNPRLYFTEYIKSIFGKDATLRNEATQNVLRILYRYKDKEGRLPSNPHQYLTIKQEGVDYVVGIPSKFFYGRPDPTIVDTDIKSSIGLARLGLESMRQPDFVDDVQEDEKDQGDNEYIKLSSIINDDWVRIGGVKSVLFKNKLEYYATKRDKRLRLIWRDATGHSSSRTGKKTENDIIEEIMDAYKRDNPEMA